MKEEIFSFSGKGFVLVQKTQYTAFSRQNAFSALFKNFQTVGNADK